MSGVGVTAVAVGPMLRAALVRCRIDARRPASWLGLLAVASAAGLLPGSPSPWWPALPIVTGGLAAAAAIGGPPRATPGMAAAWAMTRAAWPVAGLGIAAAVGRVDPSTTIVIVLTIAVTATMIAMWLERAATPGDAVSLALVAAAVAAAAAVLVRVAWPPAAPVACVAAAAAWSVVAGVAACSPWREIGGDEIGDAADPTWAAMSGAWGRLWLHAAMVSGLAGMAAWLLLAPERAWCYCLLAGGWFVAVAVPLATLGPGSGGESGRRGLAATAARGIGRSRLTSTLGQAGAIDALATAGTFAAVLGWPPLVAELLARGGAVAGGHLLITVALAAAVGATGGIVAGVTLAGGSRDTAVAVALAVALAMACIAAAKSAEAGKFPGTPGRTDVERSARSCKTPPRSPRHGGSVSCLDYPASARAI